MVKQQVHAWVDSEVYLSLKTNKINISSTVNKLLKEYIEIADEEAGDILQLQDQMNKIKQERENKTKEIELIAVKIAKLKEDKEKQDTENHEKRIALIESIKRSGVLHE